VTAPAVAIERLEVVPLEIPMLDATYRFALLELHADGAVGLGEAPALRERDGDLAAICAELRDGRPRHPASRAAWAAAALDLEARAAGVPVATLLGGAHRRAVRCARLVDAVSPAAVARQVESSAAAGFRTFKLKAAATGGPLDLERLGAARWGAGRGANLRIDFNGVLASGASEQILRSLCAFDLELAEQPLPAAAPVEEWLRLASAGAPLAADESLADATLAAGLAAAGVGLAMKLATVGGPRSALELAARASGHVLLGSSYETSVGLAAAVHVACALAAEPLDCGLATRDLLDADLATGLRQDGALLALPEGPGLGVELDRGAVARYRLDR
jgi:L-alanine-DL-glutamate epimerase-like enolase superfamily enzyme